MGVRNLAQGPVCGPALFPARASFVADLPARLPPRMRRPIGTGIRDVVRTDPAHVASRRLARPQPKARRMKRVTFWSTAALALVLSIAAVAISAAVDTPRTLMSRADYVAARRVIENDTRAALAQCRGTSGAEREVCRAEASGADRVKKADLQVRYHGTVAASQDARVVRAKVRYEVAKARCGAQKAGERPDCLRAARAALDEARLAAAT
jgi:hypothetical protein